MDKNLPQDLQDHLDAMQTEVIETRWGTWTRAQLSAALDLITPKGNWKAPAVGIVLSVNLPIYHAAVEFYQASELHVTPGGEGTVIVRSDGYQG